MFMSDKKKTYNKQIISRCKNGTNLTRHHYSSKHFFKNTFLFQRDIKFEKCYYPTQYKKCISTTNVIKSLDIFPQSNQPSLIFSWS